MIYEKRTTSMTVLPVDHPIFSEHATAITIVDESGGEFVEVSQSARTDLGKIAIAPEEWPMLRAAIDDLIKQCRGDK